MKIVEAAVELVSEVDAEKIMKHIERAGRVCYKSESRISDKSAEKFIANIIKSGHESVIEHVSLTFKIICDRGVTHEIVRHRLASYCVTGDTLIPSYTNNKRKTLTIKTLYDWLQDSKCHAALSQFVIRSFDESTHKIVPNQIKNVFFNGIQDVFELRTESGRTIKCTGGHKFFTDDGWKRLDELESENFIYINGKELLENEDWIRYNYLTLNKTRKQIAAEIGCRESSLYKALKKFDIVKSWSDIPDRKNSHSYNKNRDELSVSGGYDESYGKFSSIKVSCEDNIKILCSTGHKLWHRPKAIGAFKDKIVSIRYVGKEKVYDLEMKYPHKNYIANGIIVHNSQESSRYCNYSSDKFGNELTFIKPCFWNDDEENYKLWKETLEVAEKNYLAMIKNGVRPEQARSILPNSLKTEIFMTANLREWRHFLKLRCSKKAHPQMREVALKIHKILVDNLPVIFSDIEVD